MDGVVSDVERCHQSQESGTPSQGLIMIAMYTAPPAMRPTFLEHQSRNRCQRSSFTIPFLRRFAVRCNVLATSPGGRKIIGDQIQACVIVLPIPGTIGVLAFCFLRLETMKPPGWGKSSLTKYLDTIRDNWFATFHKLPTLFSTLSTTDEDLEMAIASETSRRRLLCPLP